ncbi:hypothetical protein [Tenacibaculum sp. E3R01]|nr:hypothetical protein [Tenacibaculum sp. E3R01]
MGEEIIYLGLPIVNSVSPVLIEKHLSLECPPSKTKILYAG